MDDTFIETSKVNVSDVELVGAIDEPFNILLVGDGDLNEEDSKLHFFISFSFVCHHVEVLVVTPTILNISNAKILIQTILSAASL